jgi:hypothetical protein
VQVGKSSTTTVFVGQKSVRSPVPSDPLHAQGIPACRTPQACRPPQRNVFKCSSNNYSNIFDICELNKRIVCIRMCENIVTCLGTIRVSLYSIRMLPTISCFLALWIRSFEHGTLRGSEFELANVEISFTLFCRQGFLGSTVS